MVTSLVVSVALASMPRAVAGGPGEAPPAPRPMAKLSVSTHSGPASLELALAGELPGVTSEWFKACYISVESRYLSPEGMIIESKEDLPCVDPKAEDRFPERFEKVLTLMDPGKYIYRIVLYPHEGRRQVFMSQEVRVYTRSGMQVGLTPD